MTSRHLLTFNAPSGGTQQPQPDSNRDAFRSGGQTYETPRRPTVSVPRPNPSGQPPSGETQRRRGR